MAKKRTSRVVSATVAAKTLGALIDRVRQERAVYVIERGGTAVARVVPMGTAPCTLADLADVLKRRADLEPAYLDEVEAGVQAWNQPSLPGDPWTS